MPTRRNFLRTAGLAFCSCCMLDNAKAQLASTRTPVTVAGKRVKTIDTHCHCLFSDAVALMGDAAQSVMPPTKGVAEHFLQQDGGVAARLKLMDDMAIDMEVLSVNPYWYKQPRDIAAKICAINNEALSQLCSAHPDRFAAYASIALQYPDMAVQQLDDAMRKQGLKGAAIGGTVLGESFSQPRFDPVWAKAEELGAVLFIHPGGVPELAARVAGNGWLANTAAYPLETTVALQHLIFEGTLDKFPKLKILSAHGGGYFPSYAPRADHGCFVSPQNCNPGIVLKKQPTEYLNQLYFDSLVFTPEALRHLAAQVGASQIMLGTDAPIPWELHPVDPVMATASFSDEEKAAILGGNAMRLFGLTS